MASLCFTEQDQHQLDKQMEQLVETLIRKPFLQTNKQMFLGLHPTGSLQMFYNRLGVIHFGAVTLLAFTRNKQTNEITITNEATTLLQNSPLQNWCQNIITNATTCHNVQLPTK